MIRIGVAIGIGIGIGIGIRIGIGIGIGSGNRIGMLRLGLRLVWLLRMGLSVRR